MNQLERATLFIDALNRQVYRKQHFKDGIEALQNPDKLVISIAEELGEVVTDYARGRYYGAIVECIDVAHSALLLAVTLDTTGEVLRQLFGDD